MDLGRDPDRTTTRLVWGRGVEGFGFQVAASGDVVGGNLLIVVAARLIEHRRGNRIERQVDVAVSSGARDVRRRTVAVAWVVRRPGVLIEHVIDVRKELDPAVSRKL